MAPKAKVDSLRGSTEPDPETRVREGVYNDNQPIPIEENAPAGELTISALQAAVDDRFKKNEADLEKVNHLMLLGFFVLLVMVASIVVIVVLDYKNSASQLQRDQYEFLNKKIDNLENISTKSAKFRYR